MKILHCLALATVLVNAAIAADPTPTTSQKDPMLAAIEQATVVNPNPPPKVVIEHVPVPTVAPAAKAIVLPPASSSNAVFTADGATTPASAIVGRLAPPTADDLKIDALTRERARIRLVGDYEAEFRGATVGDVTRALAEYARMRYIAPSNDLLSDTVSISGTYNILDLLDTLQDAPYNVEMTFERGIWRFNKATPDAVVLRTYRISNNDRESVDISSPTVDVPGQSGPGGSTSDTVAPSGAFKVSYDALTKDITDLLATPNPDADPKAPATKGTVKYIPETGDLFVLASPYHQGLVKDYLAKVDQPLDEIEFSAYFVETSRNPTEDTGINWQNAISATASGLSAANASKFVIPQTGILSAFNFAAVMKFTATDTQSEVTQHPVVVGLPNRKTVLDATIQEPFNSGSASLGGGAGVAGTQSSVERIDIGTIVNMYPVVRHMPDGTTVIRLHVSLVVSTYLGDKDLTTGLTTAPGSVSSANTSAAGASPQAAANAYATTYAAYMAAGAGSANANTAALAAAAAATPATGANGTTTSSTATTDNIVPITSRRRFEFSAELTEGDTLAIGGLMANSISRTINKVPYLSAIPVLGSAFKEDSDNATRSNMIVYITPRILRSHRGESALTSGLPLVWPVDTSFSRPVFTSQGASVPALSASMQGFSRELDAVQVYINEGQNPTDIVNRLRSLSSELDCMRDYLKSLRAQRVAVDQDLVRQVDSLSSRAASQRRGLFMDQPL